MGHWDITKYHLKLNKGHPNCGPAMSAIYNEIKSKNAQYDANRVESFSASVKEDKNEMVVSLSSYKSGISAELSLSTLNMIKSNVLSSPQSYYYRDDDGHIRDTCGDASKVVAYLVDAKHSRDAKNFPDKLRECLGNTEALAEVIKAGEKHRLLGSLKNKTEYHHYWGLSFSKDNKLDERWIAYFMVYGTDKAEIVTRTEGRTMHLHLKEALFLDDSHRDGTNWGRQVLKAYMSCGIDIPEGTAYLSGKLDNAQVEEWFQKHKTDFKETRSFSESTLQSLEPETRRLLEVKLQELNHKPVKPRLK